MGAKKKREEPYCWQKQRLPGCPKANENRSTKSDLSGQATKCSLCCNTNTIASKNFDVPERNELINCNPSEEGQHNPSSTFKLFSVNYLPKSLLSSESLNKCSVGLLVPYLIVLLLVSSHVVQVESVCVWQGGGGFKVACGFRQSGMFRLRSLGGIKGYVGAGFTIGDEDGFKDSLTNTEGHYHPQQQQHHGYLNPNVNSQRSLPNAQNGLVGQFSQIHEHAVPIPTGDPKLQQQQKMQYLQTIQEQMNNDHQNLELSAADQRSQKMLEQQMYLQGGMVAPPAPTPTAKVKRAEGGLTKRASLWNWNPFGRGKNTGKPKNKKPKHHEFDGPPPPHHLHHRGPPPPNRRSGPPPKPNNQRRDRPPPREERFHDRHGGRRGPPPNRPPKDFGHGGDSFLKIMKNPFSHLQENFIGKSESHEGRRPHQFQHEQHDQRQEQQRPDKNFPPGHPQRFEQQQRQQSQQNSQQQGNMRQVPETLMMPPAGPPLPPTDLPQFKKFPNNLRNKDNDDEKDYGDGGNDEQYRNQQQRPPQIDRMMPTDDQDTNYNNSPEQNDRDPAGLKMLKRTENFGTLFHLVNPDGSPVNMQFEKTPVLPSNMQFSSQQQQDLAEQILMHDGGGLRNGGLGAAGGQSLDSPLATAVYDPNVFPDIYFTTTERQKQNNADLLQNHNLLDGISSAYPGLSQELLELHANQLRRIMGSAERASSGEKRILRKKIGMRSNEEQNLNDISTEMPTKLPKRKMRRRKKFRVGLNNNQVDNSEPETTGLDALSVLPKRRRKGRRKKKYRLHTVKTDDEAVASSTERMGLPAGATGGEQASTESKTEVPTLDPLTTTPATLEIKEISLVSSTENKIKSSEKSSENKSKNKSKEKPGKTSFSLPSSEDVRPSPSTEIMTGPSAPSAENKIDVTLQPTKQTTTTLRTTSTEETTTQTPFSFSPFGYNDAVRKQEAYNDDYDAFSGPTGSGGDYFRNSYDPRFPPDHEVNRGHNMTKFIRPRGPNLRTPSSTSTSTSSPFILYDMTGTRNQSRFSSKFDKHSSPFRLDTEDENNQSGGVSGGPGRTGFAFDHQHPFYANSKLSQDEKGVFVKFDSREWANEKKKNSNSYHRESDSFSHQYNKTGINSGYYGGSKEFRPSVEAPSSLMDWEKKFGPNSQGPVPSPVYPGHSKESNSKLSSIEQQHGLFGPTMATFGLPTRTTTTPFSAMGDSGELPGNKQRKLHQNLFGGSSADVSDNGNWASPNFWGNVEEAGRYGPKADFDTNNNLKRLLNFGDPNGLKEINPGDLSSPTPMPMPSPSPTHQGTLEDIDSPDYFLSPSTPGSRWGKQRKKKVRPTPVPTQLPTPAPMHMSPSSTTKIPAYVFPIGSTTTGAPDKWLAVMSNEVDMPAEYFDNMPVDPNMSLRPGASSSSIETDLKKKTGKGKKSGIEIKFRSGEERDPEEEAGNEEEQQQVNSTQSRMDILAFPQGPSGGFPGDLSHDFESSQGFSAGNPGLRPGSRGPPQPPVPSSEIGYFPNVNNGDRNRNNVPVPSGPTGPPSSVMFPPVNPFNSNNGPSQHQRPVFPGNNRKDFVPSVEDISRSQEMNSPHHPQNGRGGLPSHRDNPFRLYEKQNAPGGHGMGFVSANNELKDMEHQITRFSTIPDEFLRRDSSERKHGHSPNMNEHHPYFEQAAGGPSSNDMNIPGFVNIPLPNMNSSPGDPTVNEGHHGHEQQLPSFMPSGQGGDYRESEKGSYAGPPSGMEGYPPSGPSINNENGIGPNAPPGMKDSQWNSRPVENEENELIPPHERHEETSTRRPLLHLDLVNQNKPQFPAGHSPEGDEPRRPFPGNEERPPPPHLRDERFGPPSPQFQNERQPPHLRDDRPPPPHLMEERLPPHLRGERLPLPPPHLRDEGPPHSRDERPPPHLRDEGPPPHLRDERPPPPHLRDERPPPPHLRDERPPPPHLRNERPPPPHLRDGRPPHMRDERPPPPGHLRRPPPPRNEHERPPHPPLREDRGRPLHRDDQHGPPHERPRRPHEFPVNGPHLPPDFERRPPLDDRRDFPPHRDGPPHHMHDDRFRDGPNRGPQPHALPPKPGPGGPLYPPSRQESLHFDSDQRNFHERHKTIENLRPPSRNQFQDDSNADPSDLPKWQDSNRRPDQPHIPPIPHGMPNFLDLQKIPKHQQPFNDDSLQMNDGAFLLKPPPPPMGKKPMQPTKIPPQVFKPPPPPSKPQGGNFFSNMLSGSFGNKSPPKPRPQQNLPQLRPPPIHPPPRKPPVHLPPNGQNPPNQFSKIPVHNDNPSNYINAHNDRYEPPPPPHDHENPNKNPVLRPPPPPPPFQEHGSKLPFLPFPPGDSSFETQFVDLDKNPHAHLLPPTLNPNIPDEDASLPVRAQQQKPQRPIYQPPQKQNPKDETSKVLEAFETLNKANVDVIQSLAADKYGPKFIDKIKTKTNMMSNDQINLPSLHKPLFPLKVESLPIVTTTTTTMSPMFNMFAAFTTKKPAIQEENAKLAELLKMINKSQQPSQQMAAASTMGSSSDQISSWLQNLSKPMVTPAPPTTTTTQRPDIPSNNPGLVSLTSALNNGASDIKTLQAQLAKAIIAKAHRKNQPEQPALEKPHFQPLGISASANESPLAVLQQLAQNRQAIAGNSNNYTASQIETLKKLIALNNIEQKLKGASPTPTAPSLTGGDDALTKLQALLPAALTSKPPSPSDFPATNTITRKMLDSSNSDMSHNNNLLQNPDPTILALKAIALSKAQGVNPQPNIAFPQQVKPTEPSSPPIAVDLSAILSPSPPGVEMSRKRRLTNVKNAPKSFFPANATQGFEDYSSFPLISEFQCDEQSFFPGLYADTELGCRVFHLCAKTDAGYMMKSFRCPKETVFDQEVLRCNWNLFVDCPASKNKYHFNKYLSQSFQFLKILGEFSANYQKSNNTMTG